MLLLDTFTSYHRSQLQLQLLLGAAELSSATNHRPQNPPVAARTSFIVSTQAGSRDLVAATSSWCAALVGAAAAALSDAPESVFARGLRRSSDDGRSKLGADMPLSRGNESASSGSCCTSTGCVSWSRSCISTGCSSSSASIDVTVEGAWSAVWLILTAFATSARSSCTRGNHT